MRSGIDFQWFADQPAPWTDLAEEMLRRLAAGDLGVFQYSDVSIYVAMRMLDTKVGDVRDWLMPRLFEPLGIHNPHWQHCPKGWIIGGSGLELRTEELGRIGQLLRDRGDWHGTRLVAADWIDQMHSSWVDTGLAPPFGHSGFGAWKGPESCWRLDGKFGQYVIVDERKNAVVAITAHEETLNYRLAELAYHALSE